MKLDGKRNDGNDDDEEVGVAQCPFFSSGSEWRNDDGILLFRMEGRKKVHLYEPLQENDLKARIRDGWKEVKEKTKNVNNMKLLK